MKSRMEKYYSSENEFVRRSKKNEPMYREKDYTMYTSNETVIDTNNEIDLTKLKDIIQSREDYKRAKSYRNMLNDKKFENIDVNYYEEEKESKEYDINSLLEKVKQTQGNSENDIRKLRNTQFDILKNLDVDVKSKNQNEELKELIGAISKTRDNAQDLLSELKSENTLVTDPVIEKDEEEVIVKKEELTQTRDDFYSDSITFTKKDFVGMLNLESSVNTNNTLIKILIFISILAVITAGIFIIDYFFNILSFL